MSLIPLSIGVSGYVEQGFNLHIWGVDPQSYLASTGSKTYRQNAHYSDSSGGSWPPSYVNYDPMFVLGPPLWPPSSMSSQWTIAAGNAAKVCDYISATNEPVGHSVADYVNLLKLTHTAVKSGNPACLMLAPGYYEGAPGQRFSSILSAFLATPGIFVYLDLFEYHCYAGAPETVQAEMLQVHKMLSDASLAQGLSAVPEIALSEVGYTTVSGVLSSVTTAQLMDYYSFLPLLLRATRGIRIAEYYALRDDANTTTFDQYYGIYNKSWVEKVPGLISLIKYTFAEAHAALEARTFVVDGVYYVWYTCPDERLAIRRPAGSANVVVNTDTGPMTIAVGTRAVILKGHKFTDFNGGVVPPDYEAQIMALQEQLGQVKQQLADAQASLAALQTDLTATDKQLADAQAAVTENQAKVAALQAKIDAAKAALA